MCKAARAESSRFKLHGKAAPRLDCTVQVTRGRGECESRTAMAIEYAISSEMIKKITANVRYTRLVSN